MTNQSSPTNTASLTNALCTIRKYMRAKATVAIAMTTGIIDSNRARQDSRIGKIAKATTNARSQIRNPNRTALPYETTNPASTL